MNFVSTWKKIKNKLSSAFPAVDYLSLNPVGLDITNSAIRVVKLESSEYGYVPKKYKEIKFTKKINITDIDSVLPEDIESVVQVLKKLKNEMKIKYVVVSLPEEKNYIYRTILPLEAIENVPSAIRFSLEENVPLSVKDVNFDYQILDLNEKGIDTVVSVFPKSVIEFHTDIIKKSGLKPLSFQSESVALSNAVIENSDKGLYLLMRFLDDRINIAITDGGAVQYTTTVKIQSPQVFDLNSEESKSLTHELNKVLIYWFTSRKDSKDIHKIDKAIIVGKNVANEEFEGFLEDGLKLDVIIANTWANCFDPEKHVPELNNQEAMDYAVATGLALKAIKHK